MSALEIAGVTAEVFDAALHESAAAGRALWAAQRNRQGSTLLERRRLDAAVDKLNVLRDVARLGFAEAHGWRYAPNRSHHHVDVFIDSKTRHIAARVIHGYEPFAEFPAHAERLPFSWCHGVRGHSSSGKAFAALVRELV